MNGKILFEEKQSFVGTWVWYLVLIVALFSVGGSILSAFMSTETDGIIGLSIATIVTLAIVMLLYFSKLSMIIDHESIRYRYPPFVGKEKVVRKGDINELYVRKYDSLTEYGGWGFRYSFKNGRALNIIGGEGLQIVANNDKKILIGTQKPDQLRYAIKKLKENWEIKNGK
ncbi:MAG: hypothetical protein AB8B73_08705 [Ekhidna sp.]